jgi:hypothetical protein
MTLKRIRMELARTPEHPQGNAKCGYEFIAPLDAHGHFDADNWKALKDRCKVLRFWEHEESEHGLLVHTRGRKWIFDYDASRNEDDEPIFRFEEVAFVPGAYISVTEHNGETLPFKVITVRFED